MPEGHSGAGGAWSREGREPAWPWSGKAFEALKYEWLTKQRRAECGGREALSQQKNACKGQRCGTTMMLVMMMMMIKDTNKTCQCTKPCFKHFTNINSLNPPQNPMMMVSPLSPFYRRGN